VALHHTEAAQLSLISDPGIVNRNDRNAVIIAPSFLGFSKLSSSSFLSNPLFEKLVRRATFSMFMGQCVCVLPQLCVYLHGAG